MCDMGPNAVIRRLTFYDLFIIRSAVRAVTFKVQGQGNKKVKGSLRSDGSARSIGF